MKENLNSLPSVITLDGPGGSGKGTISQLLAKKLGWHFLDSGSIYRILAFAALEKNINPKDETSLVMLASNLNIQFKDINEVWHIYSFYLKLLDFRCCFSSLRNLKKLAIGLAMTRFLKFRKLKNQIAKKPAPSGRMSIFFANRDITTAIRSEQCGEMASIIAVLPAVRAALLDLQRNFRKFPGLIADGRDMGTVVFPDAVVKVFLTAMPEKRAERRHKQLLEQNIVADWHEILTEIKKRDDRDEKRLVAPLQPAKDAIIIDTTNLTIEEVVQKIIDVIPV